MFFIIQKRRLSVLRAYWRAEPCRGRERGANDERGVQFPPGALAASLSDEKRVERTCEQRGGSAFFRRFSLAKRFAFFVFSTFLTKKQSGKRLEKQRGSLTASEKVRVDRRWGAVTVRFTTSYR